MHRSRTEYLHSSTDENDGVGIAILSIVRFSYLVHTILCHVGLLQDKCMWMHRLCICPQEHLHTITQHVYTG